MAIKKHIEYDIAGDKKHIEYDIAGDKKHIEYDIAGDKKSTWIIDNVGDNPCTYGDLIIKN